MTVALIDERLDPTAAARLRDMGFHTVALPSCPRLSEAVASHPDMLTLLLGDTLLVEGEYLVEASEVFAEIGRLLPRLRIGAIESSFAPEYPHDCLLNSLVMGGRLFCRSESIAPEVKRLASEIGLRITDVRQGYPACTVLSLGDSHAITADRGMARALQGAGIRVLLIEDGGIELPPYEFGFIGGACGVYNKKVYFIGDISTHPHGEEIERFCLEAGFETVCLSSGRLTDLGRIIFIDSDGYDEKRQKEYSREAEERVADIH